MQKYKLICCVQNAFLKKLLLSHPACFYYVVLCPGFSLGNFQGGDSLVLPEALPWVKMLCFHAEAQFLPPILRSRAHWWTSSPVCLGEERIKLTRTGIKVPVGWILGGCGVEVVLGILVGYTWEGQGGKSSAGTNRKPIFPIQTLLIKGSLINFVASLSWPYSGWDFCAAGQAWSWQHPWVMVLEFLVSPGRFCDGILNYKLLFSVNKMVYLQLCQVVCWEASTCSSSSWVHNFLCFIPHISELLLPDRNSA